MIPSRYHRNIDIAIFDNETPFQIESMRSFHKDVNAALGLVQVCWGYMNAFSLKFFADVTGRFTSRFRGIAIFTLYQSK